MAVFNPSRTFGVEIETATTLSREQLAIAINNGFDADSINMRVSLGGGHRTSDQWKIVGDGSVTLGWEVVSPPMSGSDGEAQLKSVCKSLRQAGASNDRSTGLHVHHEARDLSGKQVGQTFALYATFQNLINYMLAPSRRSNGYAANLNWGNLTVNGADDFDNDHRAPTSGGSYGISRRASDSIEYKMRNRLQRSRYNAVNIEAVFRHGTVEFRQHQGTINGTKIWNWVLLTQSIIETAKEMRKSLKPTQTIRYEGKPNAYRAKGEFARFRSVIKPASYQNGVPNGWREAFANGNGPDYSSTRDLCENYYEKMLRYWGKRIKEFGFQEYA